MKNVATVSLMLMAATFSYTQTESKPEDGFVSPQKYTNAFFGFSVPFPGGIPLTLVSQSPGGSKPDRLSLFAANSNSKGYPVFVVLADEIASSKITDPKDALRALGVHKVKDTKLGGRDFVVGQGKSEDIYRIYYATTARGYVLYFSVFSYDRKVLEAFEHSLESIEFFDPATAKQHAGPDSRPYNGPPPAR